MSETRSDLLVLPGRMLFGELLVPVTPPKAKNPNDKRYSIKIQMAKDSEEFTALWQKIQEVGERVWGREAAAKLQNLAWCITSGIAAEKSDISIQDGDKFSPERNSGFYLVQATRKSTKGAPQIRGMDGAIVTTDAEAPHGGDGVLVMVNVWCQPEYGRMNISLEAVRKVVAGVPLGGGPSQSEVAAGAEALAALPIPKSIPGVTPVSALAAKAGAAPAAPAKPLGVIRDAEPATAETTVVTGRRRGLATLE